MERPIVFCPDGFVAPKTIVAITFKYQQVKEVGPKSTCRLTRCAPYPRMGIPPSALLRYWDARRAWCTVLCTGMA